MLFARFTNSVIEPLLNRDQVDSIQITMGEAFGVSDRGRFYDATGAIGDILQNHLLQVLATVMADPPEGQGLGQWQDAKSRLVGSLTPLTPETTVRGQYEGYHGRRRASTRTPPSKPMSRSGSWPIPGAWAGVPILIRAGKCLPCSVTEVTVRFRRPPRDIFSLAPLPPSNELRFRVHPETVVAVTLASKKPGAGWEPQMQDLVFVESPGEETCAPTTG